MIIEGDERSMSCNAVVKIEFNQRMESFAAIFHNFYNTTSTVHCVILDLLRGHSLVKMEFKQRVEKLAIRVYNRINVLQLNCFLGFSPPSHSFPIATVVSNIFHKW